MNEIVNAINQDTLIATFVLMVVSWLVGLHILDAWSEEYKRRIKNL